MTQIERELETDCSVLLLRSWFEKTIAVFGEDGFGKYGTNSMPLYFQIIDINVNLTMDEDDEPTCKVDLLLGGYDADVHGLIFTDQNFMISIKKLLVEQEIDPTCVSYASKEDQGASYVSLEVDVPTLLNWA